MEALYPEAWEKDWVAAAEEEEEEEEEEEQEEKEDGGRETTDEETDEDLEPDPPPVIRRKVSFADAFGLKLVSVLEYDNTGLVEPEDVQPPEVELIQPLVEFYMSRLFDVPSTPEELDERLEDQKVELESIELLPGTTTLRGTVRVVNLCYSKSVYIRITLDGWKSHFDLLAEYVPGSSDRKTDRFAFRYSLMPPFEREGFRVEFCLRYETSEGTFWSNNKDLNYVLFCRQRAHAKEAKEAKLNEKEPQGKRESPIPNPNPKPNHNSKRSCLKPNRKGYAEEWTDKMAAIETDIPEPPATHKAEGADRKTVDDAKIHSIMRREGHKPMVDSMRSRRRATRLARVQDYFSRRKEEELEAQSVNSANGLGDLQPQRPQHPHHHQHLPLPPVWGSSSNLFRIRHKRHVDESPQILTYHQIPLLTLDWSNDKTQRLGTADVNERASFMSSEDNIDNGPSVSELWEAFLSGTDENTDDNTSVCDIWQAFLDGPECKDHSSVPESEWLQSAASVSPSNHKTEPPTQCATTESGHTFQMDSPTPTRRDTRALAEWQPASSRHHVTPSADTDLDTKEEEEEERWQPAEAHASPPGDGEVPVCDASQKSEASRVTDTPRECGPSGGAPVSGGSVDSRTRWYKHAAQGREEKEGGIGGGGGGGDGSGGEEPFTPRIAELVTSSGETGTTEITATAESPNASAPDRISRGARPDKGLFCCGEREVTGTAHNAADDTLAFRETIRRETEDAEGDVLFTSGQGEEERFALNYTDKEVYTEGEIFRPRQTQGTRISQRYIDGKKCEEFMLRRKSEEALKRDEDEIRLELLHVDTFRQSQTGADEFRSDESTQNEVVSNCTELEGFRWGQAEEEVSHGITGQETNRKCDVEVESNRATERYAWLSDETGLQLNPTDTDSNRQKGDKFVFSKTPDEELGLVRTVKERHNGSEREGNSTQMVQAEENVESGTDEKEVYDSVSYQTEEGTGQRHHDGVIPKEPEACREISTDRINASVQTQEEVEPTGNEEASNPDHDGEFRPTEIGDECALELSLIEGVELRWSEVREYVESEKEDVLDGEISLREDAVTEKVSDFKPQHPHAADVSQRDKERVSVGKLETEVMKVLMEDAGSTQEERKQSTEMKEAQEMLMGEAESSRQDPVIVDDTVVGIELGVKEAFVESIDPDLDEGILEQMLDFKDDLSACDPSDLIHVIHPKEPDGLSEEGLAGAFDSGVFSLAELLSNPNSASVLSEGPGQNVATTGDEHSVTQSSQSLTNIALTLSPLAEEGRTAESHVPPRLTQSSPSLAEDQDSFRRITERSVTHQELCSRSVDRAVSQQESFSQLSAPLSHEDSCSSSSEDLGEMDGSVFVWWTVFYSLGHVARSLAYALLVAVFFATTFLYDFPVCFAPHAFAVCWWGYQWKRQRATGTKGVVG